MSDFFDLLVNVGVQDNGRISPELADEMRAERSYFRDMLERDLRAMYEREGVPIHSGELRAAVEAARVHWTDDEIARALGISWTRIDECMWGTDPVTHERIDEAGCALHGGHRTALESMARGVWMTAPRPQDDYDVLPPTETAQLPKPETPARTISTLLPEAAAARDEIRGMLRRLRPMTIRQVANATGISTYHLSDAVGYAIAGTYTVVRLRAWLATAEGRAALANATGKTYRPVQAKNLPRK